MHHTIGVNAGEVWRYLKSNGPASVSKLTKELALKECDVHRAVGWLCREGKVREVKEGKYPLIELNE